MFALIFVSELRCFSQQTSKAEPKDSTKIYRQIEDFSKKGKFLKFVYGLIFKPLSNKPTEVKKKKKKVKSIPISRYEGKIIRSINIIALDPFGYSIYDSTAVPHGFLLNTGNKFHLKTRVSTLKNLIIIRENQVFDSLRLKESERLIRSQPYVRDVVFNYNKLRGSKDSVDVYIRVLDNWSINGSVGVSATKPGFNITDHNFSGLGHTFEPSFHMNTKTSETSYTFNYIVPNFRNSFVTGQAYLAKNEDNSYLWLFRIDRQFVTSFNKWAGGITTSQQLRKDTIVYVDSLHFLQRFKVNTQDLWLARAWRIFNVNTEFDRITNFIVSGRFLRTKYLEKPGVEFDSLHIFSTQQFYLFGMGISTRKYIHDRYVFNYGPFEDVPVGSLYNIILGEQFRNGMGRFYIGGKISWGDYYDWGYFSTSMEYGNFIHAKRIEQGALAIGATYYTAMLEFKRWKFRQFIKPQAIIGINRYPTDTLSIISDVRPGESIPAVTGQHKLVLSLQTQSYAPYNFLGFRTGPFLVCTLGMLGTEKSGFRNSHLYSLVGIGLLLRNELLIMNNFQISITFYPRVPGLENAKFKFNSYKTSDYGFRNFDFSVPQTVIYR